MPMQINSPSWQVRRTTRSGSGRAAAGDDLAGLPAEFLGADSHIAEEAVLQPAAATRGSGAGAGGVIDLTCAIEPGHAAVLAVRHASGALTFSLPIHTTSRGVRTGDEVRFQFPVRRGTTRGMVGKAVKAIVIKAAKVAGDKAVSYLLPRLAEALEREVWSRRGLQEGWLSVSKDGLAAGTLERRAPVSPARSLLFLHGSFSNAAATFRPLADSDFFAQVKATYGDRIFAFDSFTVSRMPEESARLFLESLPDHATTFDVVTHGIGGPGEGREAVAVWCSRTARS